MTAAPAPQATRAQVISRVDAEVRVTPGVRVIAVRAQPAWPGPAEETLPGGGYAVVVPCVSALAVREALARAEADREGRVWVLLTDRDGPDLGMGITARLHKERVLTLDRWQHLAALFGARSVDPRLVAENWAVDAIVDGAPPGGYRKVPAGHLDRETALRALAETQAGLTDLDLDLAGLLRWTTDGTRQRRWGELPPDVRGGLADWLATRTATGDRSPTVDAVLAAVGARRAADAVPFGLAAGALVGQDAPADTVAPRAALVAGLLGTVLAPEVVTGWAEAAESLVERAVAEGRSDLVNPVLARAERLLADAGGTPYLERSNLLESSFGRRMAGLGRALTAALESGDPASMAAVEAALDRVRAHGLEFRHRERVRRAQMAVRLVRWLALTPASDVSLAEGLAEAARRQESVDAWVDNARARVWEGDVDPDVQQAYTAVWRAVEARRGGHDRQFALLLSNHVATGSSRRDILGVEDVLREVVEPLARERPVLLLVVDGMSTSVATELVGDLRSTHGWVAHALSDPRPVISALPSVTRVSRTSLLTGTLADGDAGAESRAFAARGWPLFHKADLTRAAVAAALPAPVAEAVANTRLRVVGVVVNDVDDTLDKGSRAPWTAESIDRLVPLLDLARQAGRVVLLTSDHGHVHERGSRMEPDDTGGARWRAAGPDRRPAGDGEVTIEGSRVLLGGGRIVAAWDEMLRYLPKRNGYHGGASAPEVVIPLVLLDRMPADLPGWRAEHHPEPQWWVERVDSPARTTPPAELPAQSPAQSPAPADDGTLFPSPAAPAAAVGEAPVEPVWVEPVLASPAVRARLGGGRRGAATSQQVRDVLRLLGSRGGVVTRDALARSLDVPPARVNGIVAAVGRVVNIDGSQSLRLQGDSIRLDVTGLLVQCEVTP